MHGPLPPQTTRTERSSGAAAHGGWGKSCHPASPREGRGDPRPSGYGEGCRLSARLGPGSVSSQAAPTGGASHTTPEGLSQREAAGRRGTQSAAAMTVPSADIAVDKRGERNRSGLLQSTRCRRIGDAVATAHPPCRAWILCSAGFTDAGDGAGIGAGDALPHEDIRACKTMWVPSPMAHVLLERPAVVADPLPKYMLCWSCGWG